MSADSAAERRPDHTSAHAAWWRAVSRSSGSFRDSEGAGGEILHPVSLAGRNGGRRGGDQPPCSVCAAGAQLGRAFQRQRRGARAAAMLRLGSCGFQQRSDVFVGLQGRGGQVPGSPVWLVV